MDKKKVIEIRKMLIAKALKKLINEAPISYALICFEDIMPYLVLKFRERPLMYAIDVHDYIYSNYGLDPRIFVVDTINPLTQKELMERCEFLLGSREEFEKDREITERKASEYLKNFSEAVSTVLGRGSRRET